MNLLVRFTNAHPRVSLSLPGNDGTFEVEFIVDTGFDGDLCLPIRLARLLDAEMTGSSLMSMANGAQQRCAFFGVTIDFGEDDGDNDTAARLVEVLVLDGAPLMGTQFLRDTLLTVETAENGEVTIESL